MVKKLVFILWVSLSVCPVFAQEGKLIKAGADAANNGLAQQVGRQLTEQTLHAAKVPNTVLAQISNLPGSPTVKVRLNEPLPQGTPAVLSARILGEKELFNKIALVESNQLYVPKLFIPGEQVWYRGMKFKRLDEVENLLINGLEMSKSNFPGEIYVSPSFRVALSYGLALRFDMYVEGPARYSVPEGSFIGDNRFLVMTFIPCTEAESQRYAYAAKYQIWEDVLTETRPASMLSHIITFLEVNGQAGWYEATLENNEIFLNQLPGYYIRGLMGEFRNGDGYPMYW